MTRYARGPTEPKNDGEDRSDLELRFFTTLTTLGTPLDVTLYELPIKSYYPAADATAKWLRA